MKPQPTSTANQGEVAITLGGAVRQLRFGMNTLRDYSTLTGSAAGGFAADLSADYNAALCNLVFCAVKRYTPATELPENFSADVVGDWLDSLTTEDGEVLATAVLQCLTQGNALTSALLKKIVPTSNN